MEEEACDHFKPRFLRRKYCKRCSRPRTAHSIGGTKRKTPDDLAAASLPSSPQESGRPDSASGPTAKLIRVAPAEAQNTLLPLSMAASSAAMDSGFVESLK